MTAAAASAAVAAPHVQTTPGELADFHHLDAVTPTEAPAPVAAAAAAPKPAPRPVSSMAKKPAAKKPAGKLGLGVKKLAAKVDEAVFDQAPSEPVVAPVVAGPLSDPLSTATNPSPNGKAAAVGSRFAYDNKIEETPAKEMERGKDGHLTLNAKGGGSDFFSSSGMMGGGSKSSGPSRSSGGGARTAPAPAPESKLAQTKYANAKAISSKDFQKEDRESEYENKARLNQFSNSAAISSADYYSNDGEGNGGGGSRHVADDDMDLTAADIVNRLSMQAKQDLKSVGNWLVARGGHSLRIQPVRQPKCIVRANENDSCPVEPAVSIDLAQPTCIVRANDNGSSPVQPAAPVDFEELNNILRLVNTTDIVELDLKSKRFNLVVRKREAIVIPEPVIQMIAAPQYQQMAAPPPQAPAPAAAPAASAPAPAAAPAPAPPPAAAPLSGVELLSPMGGTFYRSPAPGEPFFCKEGDKVKRGQVVGLIEAMKLMNEIEEGDKVKRGQVVGLIEAMKLLNKIEAEISGEIVAVLAESGKPIQAGMAESGKPIQARMKTSSYHIGATTCLSTCASVDPGVGSGLEVSPTADQDRDCRPALLQTRIGTEDQLYCRPGGQQHCHHRYH
eukprot:gene4183-14282_t